MSMLMLKYGMSFNYFPFHKNPKKNSFQTKLKVSLCQWKSNITKLLLYSPVVKDSGSRLHPKQQQVRNDRRDISSIHSLEVTNHESVRELVKESEKINNFEWEK